MPGLLDYNPTLDERGPELRRYRPSLLDSLRDATNSVGRSIGYPDLAQRTKQTMDLLGIASAPLAIGAAPSTTGAVAAALRGTPEFDAAAARVLERQYPGQFGSGFGGLSSNAYEGRRLWGDNAQIKHAMDTPAALQMKGTPPQWQNPFYEMHDGGAPLSAEDQNYMNALLAQIARRNMGPAQ